MKKVTLLFALATMGVALHAQENTKELPTMGWSSWNTYSINISDSIIRHQADVMAKSGLKEAGYRYINIDDGYFGGRDMKSGQLLIHPTRFPNGMKPVVDYIHSLGLKAGIYSDAGANTCGNYWNRDTIARNVGLLGHEEQDANFFFNEIGFDFIKVDYCGADAPQNHQHFSLEPSQQYAKIYEAMQKTGRKDLRLNVCRWDYPGTWVHQVATSWRMSVDINCSWRSVRDIIRQSLYLSAYAYDGRYNDMDMLEVGRTLSQEEDNTHFAMWCIMASPLLIGCDMANLRPETFELLTNKGLIALNQDSLCLQAYVADYNANDTTYILVKDIEQLYGNTRAVALYNPSETEKNITLQYTAVDLGGHVEARELTKTSKGQTNIVPVRKKGRKMLEPQTCLTIAVPAHGCRVFRLTADQRLERSLYEAETAYLGEYQELANPWAVNTGTYVSDKECSGQTKAVLLGLRANNDIQWRHVYSQEGGDYELLIRAKSRKGETSHRWGVRKQEPGQMFYMSINNGAGQEVVVNTDGQWGDTKVNIHLEKGDNVIRMYNNRETMPEFDFIKVTKN